MVDSSLFRVPTVQVRRLATVYIPAETTNHIEPVPERGELRLFSKRLVI